MNTTVVVTINLIYIPYCFFFSIIFLSSFFRRYCIDVAAAVVYMSHMSVYVYSDSLDKIEQTSVSVQHILQPVRACTIYLKFDSIHIVKWMGNRVAQRRGTRAQCNSTFYTWNRDIVPSKKKFDSQWQRMPFYGFFLSFQLLVKKCVWVRD